MREFKFFADNDNDSLDDDFVGASWVWVTDEYIDNIYGSDWYTLDVEQSYGIHSFLAQFIPFTVVKIKSIIGPDGFIHNFENEGIGWGFDITSDLITIVYYRRTI